MKTPIPLLPILWLPSIFLNAQDLSSTAEIIRIMEDSDILYNFEVVDLEITALPGSDQLIYHQYYRKTGPDGSFSTMQYNPLPTELQALMDQAEKHFSNNEIAQAQEFYKEILTLDSTYYKAQTYLGQTYGIQGDFKTAISLYRQVIQKNYIDYMAHWFLADAFLRTGEPEKALSEIITAHILNRNNPRILNSLNVILQENKKKLKDWKFIPQFEIDSVEGTGVRIRAEEEWLGWAMTEAVWRYEPGFSADRKNDIMTKTKQCIIGYISNKDKKDFKKNEGLAAFQAAADKGLIDAFILYEFVLPQYPLVGAQLTEALLEEIAQYLLTIRTEGK